MLSTETIIGFDSAWADIAPGAICSVTLRQGEVIAFDPPHQVRFDDAEQLIEKAAQLSDFVLVALDQPTVVPNASGMRPAERVAGSIVNAMGGGVQPAFRGRAVMFGNGAPIWRFLDRLCARENPDASRKASQGLYLIEVFPALALPSILPEIWRRRRGAKYNPENRNFLREDWQLVTCGLAQFACGEGLAPVASAAINLSHVLEPRKADQDKLDALICLVIGWIFRNHSRKAAAVIGDGISGYIVTPVTPATRAILAMSAAKRGVPMDMLWKHDVHRNLSLQEIGQPQTITQVTARCGRKRHSPESSGNKTCPECGHTFRGKGWGGIDAHWRAHHKEIMPYEEAREIIQNGGKPSSQGTGE